MRVRDVVLICPIGWWWATTIATAGNPKLTRASVGLELDDFRRHITGSAAVEGRRRGKQMKTKNEDSRACNAANTNEASRCRRKKDTRAHTPQPQRCRSSQWHSQTKHVILCCRNAQSQQSKYTRQAKGFEHENINEIQEEGQDQQTKAIKRGQLKRESNTTSEPSHARHMLRGVEQMQTNIE